jgi:hypothetical protein
MIFQFLFCNCRFAYGALIVEMQYAIHVPRADV